MKISLNWAQQYSNVDLKSIPRDELISRIGAQLGAIESVEDFGSRFDGILVATIVSSEKHPNADKLHICRIDDGGMSKNIERGEDGMVQVVCGAPNCRTGMIVAWIPPGITVPATLDKQPLVLQVREIRGIKSNGMLASPSELGISDNHDGILEIEVQDAGEDLIKPGTEFKKLYGLDDLVIDLENKMFTHRPDCFGILGIARELAGITGQKFTSPDWYLNPLPNNSQGLLKLTSKNDIPALVPRFLAQVVENITIGSSPIGKQALLTRAGYRPINNIVDLTNYYMHLSAQPLHAFDYDKVKSLCAGETTVFPRLASEGEELRLLNGKTIKLAKDDLVIATDKQAIALAGVMGGAETEVDAKTKNIIIECATFDMYAVRRTSMRHGLFTAAAARFNKGQSPLQNDKVLAKLVNVLVVKNEAVAGQLVEAGPQITSMPEVSAEIEFINSRLGAKLSAADMVQYLENVEISSQTADDKLNIVPPFWRRDLELAEDIVEEIGRLYGYAQLPIVLPPRTTKPAKKDLLLELKAKISEALKSAGANEALTYSFVHGDLITKVGQDTTKAFRLSNALSPDLQYYRLSLTPSLLEKVHPNIKAGFSEFVLYEIGKAHVQGENDSVETDIPKEVQALSLVFASDAKKTKNQNQPSAYYQAKKYLDYLLYIFGSRETITFELLDGADLYKNPWVEQQVAPYEPGHSAVLRDGQGLIWGVVGEYKSSVRQALKLPNYSAGFDIDPTLLFNNSITNYSILPKFPKVVQDISLRVPDNINYGEINGFLLTELNKLMPKTGWFRFGPVDIFQKPGDNKFKHYSFRFTVADYQKTMTSQEVNALLDKIADAAKQKFGAERL